MENPQCKRMKNEGNFPKVYKGAAEIFNCSTWNLDDWAVACDSHVFNFRIGPKEITPTPQWENEAQVISATLFQFCNALNENGTPNFGTSENPFRNVNFKTHWLYTAYNYMFKVLGDSAMTEPGLYDIVNWSVFGLENRDAKDSTLWIGTAGSHTPCHQDAYGENLVAQISGRKLWVLFPPEEACNMYPTRIPYEESTVFSSISTLNPDYQKFPKFADAKIFAVVLEPGDILYVPPKWWHYVHCLDTAVSVNTWIETKKDNLHRLEEAVVRTLITALVPTYQPKKESWLNQNEHLMSPDENATVLAVALRKALEKEAEPNTLHAVNFDSSKIDMYRCSLVPEVSHRELEQLLNILEISPFITQTMDSRPKNMDQTFANNVLKKVLNSILHPQVIESIIKQLTE